MKIRILMTVFLLACSYFNCYAQTFDENSYEDINAFVETCVVIEDKVYIEPNVIYVSSQEILINVNGHLLPITNLSSDENGIFVSLEELKVRKKAETWTCRYCGRKNLMTERFCGTCKRSWDQTE